VAVSMSWGGSEFSGESSYDSYFSHPGVTFVASSGDSGAPASYPATSPNILAVGGTSLYVTSTSAYSSESGWSGSGGGTSGYEAQPSYQKGIVTQTTTRRSNPDVAYDADPNTGFPVYDTFGSTGGWGQYGGTSDAAPQWAALIAIADQGRAAAGQQALNATSPTQTLSLIYGLSASDFHDITTGSSAGRPALYAGVGYDQVTGRGTPVANLVVADLVGTTVPATPHATSFAVSAPTSVTAGGTFSVTVTAKDASNNNFTGYTGIVQLSDSDLQGFAPVSYQFTSGDMGVHTFTGLTLKTAGAQTMTATDATNNLTGNATVSVTAAPADHLAFGQQPSAASPGGIITPAVTVQVLDQYGNLETGDNTDTITLTLSSNPGSAALSGGTATVVGGVATFNSLSVSTVGNGYTLLASSGTLKTATSASFNVSNSTILEDFESGLGNYYYVGYNYPAFYQSTAAKHDGTYGLLNYANNDWIFRDDSAAQVKAGDTVSVWLRFSGLNGARAYFGFGASGTGTLSLVAAPNSGQLILQSNAGYGYTNLAAVNQSYQSNHWYRMEVDWGTSGTIVGKLFDSNGTTLLGSVTASTTAITSGGVAFRGIGSTISWDTVTVAHGVNQFLNPAPTGSSTGTSSGSGSTGGTHSHSGTYQTGFSGLGVSFAVSAGQVPGASTLVGPGSVVTGSQSSTGSHSASTVGTAILEQLFGGSGQSAETSLLTGEEWLAKLFGEG
jgi:hypothetical protein